MATMMEDLAALGKEIEGAKKSVSQLEGRRTEVMNRLNTEFGVTTIGNAEELLAELTEQVRQLDEHIAQDFEELKRHFSW